jgi:hypothetical protein
MQAEDDTNAWHWWEQALADPKAIGKSLTVSIDTPEQGFYRMRYGATKPWLPVAIWQDNGNWIALRAGKKVDAQEVWNWCCGNPVSSEAYEKALSGEGWADDEPIVQTMMGHNVSDTDDLEILADQIEAARQGAEIYADIQSEEEAGKAQSLRARMNELAGQADKIREKLKKPHFEAGKRVDAQWMPLVKEAKAVADQLRKNIETFKTAQLMELRRAELERAKLDIAATPEPLPTPETTVKGGYGRAASVGVELVVTKITDELATYQFLRGAPELTQCILALAQKAIRSGQTVPGVEVEERAKIS